MVVLTVEIVKSSHYGRAAEAVMPVDFSKGDTKVLLSTDATADANFSEIVRCDIRDRLSERYRELRDQAPLFWSPSHDACVASSYEVVNEILRHPEAVVDAKAAEAYRRGADGPWFDLWCRMMLFLDPPDHALVRHLFTRMFTRRAVERLRPISQQVVARLLEDVVAGPNLHLLEPTVWQSPLFGRVRWRSE
jgi:cytochrome P450